MATHTSKKPSESVLNQAFKAYEIIVVDDGSTDSTAAVCKSFGNQIKVYTQDHQGSGAARNLGVDKATGNYLAFLDADDIWTPTHLRDSLAALAKADAADLVFGMMTEFYSPETDQAFRQTYGCRLNPFAGLSPGTLLIKRSDFQTIGKFNTEYESGVTVDWLSRNGIQWFDLSGAAGTAFETPHSLQ